MKNIPKPITTYYNGIIFRSRLESSWAVFFDDLQWKYSYEPEKFNLGDFNYIPDFWLPDLDVWIEIKPEKLNSQEQKKAISKCKLLAKKTKKEVWLIQGNPHPMSFSITKTPSFDHIYQFNECQKCGSIFLEKLRTLEGGFVLLKAECNQKECPCDMVSFYDYFEDCFFSPKEGEENPEEDDSIPPEPLEYRRNCLERLPFNKLRRAYLNSNNISFDGPFLIGGSFDLEKEQYIFPDDKGMADLISKYNKSIWED